MELCRRSLQLRCPPKPRTPIPSTTAECRAIPECDSTRTGKLLRADPFIFLVPLYLNLSSVRCSRNTWEEKDKEERERVRGQRSRPIFESFPDFRLPPLPAFRGPEPRRNRSYNRDFSSRGGL